MFYQPVLVLTVPRSVNRPNRQIPRFDVCCLNVSLLREETSVASNKIHNDIKESNETGEREREKEREKERERKREGDR